MMVSLFTLSAAMATVGYNPGKLYFEGKGEAVSFS